MNHLFSHEIEKWYRQHGRDLPWRMTTDPYKIWVSEIILQQTRVDQGMAYYERFLEAFPTVSDLAQASEEQVLLLWQGLGYYSRARHLHAAAKAIVAGGGEFPTDRAGLMKLPGIGEYTSRAIMSFAFGKDVAVVDGNVYRVLARYLGIDTPIDTTRGKHEFQLMAEEMLDKQHPSLYNQAIMDFGALLCKPQSPLCEECPVALSCVARRSGTVDSLPVKERKVKVRDRYFSVVYVHTPQGDVLLQQRNKCDIWKGLFQFPLIESPEPLPASEVEARMPRGELTLVETNLRHVLTHQILHVDFYTLLIPERIHVEKGVWATVHSLPQYALPQLMVRLLKKIQSAPCTV